MPPRDARPDGVGLVARRSARVRRRGGSRPPPRRSRRSNRRSPRGARSQARAEGLQTRLEEAKRTVMSRAFVHRSWAPMVRTAADAPDRPRRVAAGRSHFPYNPVIEASRHEKIVLDECGEFWSWSRSRPSRWVPPSLRSPRCRSCCARRAPSWSSSRRGNGRAVIARRGSVVVTLRGAGRLRIVDLPGTGRPRSELRRQAGDARQPDYGAVPRAEPQLHRLERLRRRPVAGRHPRPGDLRVRAGARLTDPRRPERGPDRQVSDRERLVAALAPGGPHVCPPPELGAEPPVRGRRTVCHHTRSWSGRNSRSSSSRTSRASRPSSACTSSEPASPCASRARAATRSRRPARTRRR